MYDSKEPDVGCIFHSLNNSSARYSVYEYILSMGGNDPKKVSVKQISSATGFSERAVLGALIGDGSRYKVEDSLVEMGLAVVFEENSYGHILKLFSVTQTGLKLKPPLEDYVNNNKRSINCIVR